jgi:hypothetical protein
LITFDTGSVNVVLDVNEAAAASYQFQLEITLAESGAGSVIAVPTL